MFIEVSLLDALTKKMDCEYLSDLHYLPYWERERLVQEIESIPACEYPLSEWNDALEYLTGNAPERNVGTARERLITALRSEE